MTSWMKKIIPVAVILLCLMTAFPAQGALTAKAPSYSVGDYWNYGDVSAASDTMKISVSTASKSFNGATCIEEKDQIFVSGTWMNTSMYYRASDAAFAGSYIDMSTSGMTLKMTMIAKPITPQYKYPLTVGKTWRVTFTEQTTTDMSYGSYNVKTTSNSTYDWNFTVTAEESVTVAAGTFDALKITSSTGNGDSSVTWYSPKVGNMVKATSTSGSSTSTVELKSYTFKNSPSGGGGTTTTGGALSGMMLYGLIMVIVIIVVVLVVVMVMMKKKKAAPVQPGMAPMAQPGQPMAPAQQPQYQPPQQPQYQPPQQPQYQPPQQVQQYQQPAQQAYDQAQQYQQPAQQAYDQTQQYQQPPQAQQYAPPPQAPAQYPPQPPQY